MENTQEENSSEETGETHSEMSVDIQYNSKNIRIYPCYLRSNCSILKRTIQIRSTDVLLDQTVRKYIEKEKYIQ